MLLLSLGPEAIVALLCQGQPRAFSGPDLTWLLFGPEMAQAPVAEPPGSLNNASKAYPGA